MWGIVPYAGAAFMVYEWSKERVLRIPMAVTMVHSKKMGQEKKQLKVWAHLLVGAVAGMLGQTVSYPFDTIRHRMQLEGIAHGIPKYRSTADAVKMILRQEGWRGFFVGLSINYWKTMPANAIAFVVYDRMKNVLEI